MHRVADVNTLRELRRSIGLKQEEFALLLQVPLETLRTWDSGRRAVPARVVALIDLALMGFWPPSAPIKPLERLYPVIWLGFWVNLVTGSVLLVAEATKRLTNPDFFVKMVCVFGGVFLLHAKRPRIFDDPQLDAAPVSGRAKMLAWLSLGCWFGAILTGRLLAYTSTSK